MKCVALWSLVVGVMSVDVARGSPVWAVGSWEIVSTKAPSSSESTMVQRTNGGGDGAGGGWFEGLQHDSMASRIQDDLQRQWQYVASVPRIHNDLQIVMDSVAEQIGQVSSAATDEEYDEDENDEEEDDDKDDEEENDDQEEEEEGDNDDNLRLISISPNEEPQWLPESAKDILRAQGIKFADITEDPSMGSPTFFDAAAPKQPEQYPAEMRHTRTTRTLISEVNTKYAKMFLPKYSEFRTRYYKSATGAEAANWLAQRIRDIVQNGTMTERTSVNRFLHPWGQDSIIVRIEPVTRAEQRKTKQDIVILSAHLDSTNLIPFLPSPGADDDGSGTSSLLEVLRVLSEQGLANDRPLELHWYSAEEGGLLGSQAIASKYRDDGALVKGALQMDMTGFVKDPSKPVIGVIQDYVSAPLTAFVEKLVDQYATIPAVQTQCGYACSDHDSWRRAGYPSSFIIESTFADSNHAIHSTGDTYDKLDFDHMMEFTKVAIGFAVELTKAE